MNFERKLSKDDREIYTCLKPFARFFSQQEFDELFEGLVLEKNLRQRLNQLKAYQEMNLKTYEDVEKYLEMDNRRNKDEKKSNLFYENGVIGLKLDKEISSVVDELSQAEKDFVRKKNIPNNLYSEIKHRLLTTKDSKNSIKTSIIQKFNCSREDIDIVADFIVKLKKN